MTQYPAVVSSIDKDKVVLECARGPVLRCVFTRGNLSRVGNKGVAVVNEESKEIKFRGPRGAMHLRLIAVELP